MMTKNGDNCDSRRRKYERKGRMFGGGILRPWSWTMESLFDWWHIVISRLVIKTSQLALNLHSYIAASARTQMSVRRSAVETHREPTGQRTTTTTHYKLITDSAESMSTLIIRLRRAVAGQRVITAVNSTPLSPAMHRHHLTIRRHLMPSPCVVRNPTTTCTPRSTKG